MVPHLLVDLRIEQSVHRIGEVFHKGLYIQQQAVIALVDEVYRATGPRPDGRHAGGLCLLDGLAEGLELAGVDEDVQGGIGGSEVFAGQRTGKDGTGQLGFQ